MNANASSWRHRPFQDGVPLPCSLSFSPEEFERVRAGLVPQSMMDDKWFIYYQEPFLYFHRSLTGDPVYRLKLALRHDGASVEEALLATEVSKISEESEEYDARLVDALISTLLLDQDRPFPLPWKMSKPWWRRWPVMVRRWWQSRRSPQSITPATSEATANSFVHESRRLEPLSGARIVEVLFRGRHHRSHGREMSRIIKDVLNRESPVAGVVVNLLGYDYEFGNDVHILFVAPSLDGTLRPTCIVAAGRTSDAMQSLLAAGPLPGFPITFAASVDEALAKIQSEVQR